MFAEADIVDALRVCFDLELPVNIVDLGLVHAVTLTADTDAPGTEVRYHAAIQLLRRTHDGQREAMLQGLVANRLAGIYAVSGSTVSFVSEPVWTPDRMTGAARSQLGLGRCPRPGLVQIQLP